MVVPASRCPWLLVVTVMAAVPTAVSIRPSHSWDTLSGMSFFHSCNESGLFSERALDTIAKFPFVTIEKGQSFSDPDCAAYGGAGKPPCAESKIIAQCAAVKARSASIATVFYYNAVLDWYFYHMDTVLQQRPDWQLKDSQTGKPVLAPGDKHFKPPKQGMLVFDHSNPGLREYWISMCVNATTTGHVDGCFSDSSQPETHKTAAHLSPAANARFEAGKVATMANLTAFFGGAAGEPYTGSHGVLIGKTPDQQGINAAQIEMFAPDEGSILELLDGAKKGFLMQAHATTYGNASTYGCNDIEAMTDVIAAFLVAAGDDSYFGSGPWISPGIEDVEQRWCPELFDRPIGKPIGDAVKANGMYKRVFASGTTVLFDTGSNKGTIAWSQ